MPIVVLLLIGLACLAVGLLLSSTMWLIISLGASMLAALLLYYNRNRIATARPGSPPRQSPSAEAETKAKAETGADADPGPDATALMGTVSPATPGTVPHHPPADRDVWVVDGRPRYHRESCEIIRDQPVESIPHSQANEDGFIPCSLCQPDNARAAKTSSEA